MKNKVKAMSKGTYIAAKFSEKTNEALRNIRASFGITGKNVEPTPDNFHITIAYSKTPIDIDKFEYMKRLDPKVAINLSVKAKAEIWETNTSSGRVLVLRVNSRILNMYHKIAMDCGGSHSYPEYEQHISLMYDTPENISVPANTKSIPLVLEIDKIVYEDLDDE